MLLRQSRYSHVTVIYDVWPQVLHRFFHEQTSCSNSITLSQRATWSFCTLCFPKGLAGQLHGKPWTRCLAAVWWIHTLCWAQRLWREADETSLCRNPKLLPRQGEIVMAYTCMSKVIGASQSLSILGFDNSGFEGVEVCFSEGWKGNFWMGLGGECHCDKSVFLEICCSPTKVCILFHSRFLGWKCWGPWVLI